MHKPLELMMVTFYVTLNGFVIIPFNDEVACTESKDDITADACFITFLM